MGIQFQRAFIPELLLTFKPFSLMLRSLVNTRVRELFHIALVLGNNSRCKACEPSLKNILGKRPQIWTRGSLEVDLRSWMRSLGQRRSVLALLFGGTGCDIRGLASLFHAWVTFLMAWSFWAREVHLPAKATERP